MGSGGLNIRRLIAPARLISDYLVDLKCRLKCAAAKDATFTRESQISNPNHRESVRIGRNTLCMGQLLVIAPTGQITIGDWCYVGPQSKIWAMESVVIGDRTFISHGVSIFDNNSHSISAGERHDRYRELRTQGRHLSTENVRHQAVAIHEDVWVGFNASILKGVSVGKGAIIGACSVVTHDVEPYTIVVGNPARQVGTSQP